MNRRDFLRILGGGAVALTAGGCSLLEKFLESKDEQLWGMNVHPYTGELFNLQIRALQELGIAKVRITLGIHSDMASRYINAYPVKYLGIIGDYNLSGVTPAAWPNMVRQVVLRNPGVNYFEVLNEPDLFMGLTAAAYVNNYLKPAYPIIKGLRPDAKVVSASPRGTAEGVPYFNAMTSAGADDWCDYRGAHLYHNNPEQYAPLSRKPFMVTETGAKVKAEQIDWWTNKMPNMANFLETDEIYFYVLMDNPDADGFSLIANYAGPGGSVVAVSPLYDYIKTSY